MDGTERLHLPAVFRSGRSDRRTRLRRERRIAELECQSIGQLVFLVHALRSLVLLGVERTQFCFVFVVGNQNDFLLAVLFTDAQARFVELALILGRAALHIAALLAEQLQLCHHLCRGLAVLFLCRLHRFDLGSVTLLRLLGVQYRLGDLCQARTKLRLAQGQCLNILICFGKADRRLAEPLVDLALLIQCIVAFDIFVLTICADLLDLRFERCVFFVQLCDLAAVACFLRFETLKIGTQLFAKSRIGRELCRQRIEVRFFGRDKRGHDLLLLHRTGKACLCIFERSRRLGKSAFQLFQCSFGLGCRLFQCADLRRARQDTAVAAHRTARVRAAGIDDLSI